MSPQTRKFFKNCCMQVGVSPLELLLWVRTRWASLYGCLSLALELRKAIDRFTLIAESSNEVLPLRNRSYGDYRLTLPEWERLEIIHEALREPADVTQTFSNERYLTVWTSIPTFEYLIKRWETMSQHPRYAEISEALSQSIKSFRK
ncbi:hypothetical protein B0H19DRAFT_1262118 [Mycena capillaripes]|nr:hypothetical protein B0H19DRAFT_1262118 [Mycena capillaripes]